MLHNLSQIWPMLVIYLVTGLVILGLGWWLAVMAEDHDDWMVFGSGGSDGSYVEVLIATDDLPKTIPVIVGKGGSGGQAGGDTVFGGTTDDD